MSPGDRIVVIHTSASNRYSEFQGWGTVIRAEPDRSVRVTLDHIPPNNIYGYPNEYVHPIYLIEEVPS